MSAFNTQSPPTTSEKLWAAEAKIREQEEEIIRLKLQIAALREQLASGDE